MLFGSDVKKQFFQKRIKGRGYCDVGTSVISEFYNSASAQQDEQEPLALLQLDVDGNGSLETVEL